MGSATADGCHVAIDAHLLAGEPGYRSAGIHRYIHCLLQHLGQADVHLRYTVLVGAHGTCDDPSLALERSRWPTHRAPVRAVWEQAVQPRVLRRIGADLLHAPVFVAPLVSACPSVITIHDLSFLRFPALFRPANRLYLTTMTRLSARRARRVIAVSQHAATESVELLGVDPRRVEVVYHGVDLAFRPLPTDEVEAFRQRLGLPPRFALFIGTLEPRKNLLRLIEAFARIPDSEARLIIAGGRGWFYDDLFSRVERLDLQDKVSFVGYVPQDDLPLWYGAATIFVYPSLYEGFGLPVLEAQACGVPVLTSSVSSLPEAAGEAALLVDPYDVDALTANIHRLLHDRPFRDQLRERGLAHAGQFSWSRTARETAGLYRRAIAEGNGT